MTAHQLAEQYGLPLETVYKRLKRGVPLDQRYRKRERRAREYVPAFVPDPLNAVCNAWRTPATLAALGVRRNLKARIA